MILDRTTTSPGADVAVILLAAGRSTRMGAPKQLLPYRGSTLLRHAAQEALASCCRPVTVVLGSDAARMEHELAGLPLVVAVNHAWATGMASSIHVGLAAACTAAPDAAAVIVMLCDQPLLRAALLDRLVDEWRTSGRSLVASHYGTSWGVPALFDRAWFGELARLRGDTGARALLRAHAMHVALVRFPGGAVDVDSPADHAALVHA